MIQKADIDFNSDVKAAIDCMRRGGVILYPTDTVWGIGCDATNAEAVKRIYDIKHRAEAKALITLVGSLAQLEATVRDIPDVALELVELATTPVSVVYDYPTGLAPNLTAPDGSAAIRLTSEKFSNALCRQLRRPVVSTSANISGCPTPRFFSEIAPEVIEAVDYVAHYRRGDTTVHQSSSVIKISSDSTIKIIRQ